VNAAYNILNYSDSDLGRGDPDEGWGGQAGIIELILIIILIFLLLGMIR
jgi:hypothetical protein